MLSFYALCSYGWFSAQAVVHYVFGNQVCIEIKCISMIPRIVHMQALFLAG